MIDPDDPPRTWTVAEADAVLPTIRPVIDAARAAVARHGGRVVAAGRAATGRTNGHAEGGNEAAEVGAAIAQLDAMGILLRDPARGLVDFPARSSSGRPYWLCWLVDEPAVGWWHWPEAGFAGRTAVSQLPD